MPLYGTLTLPPALYPGDSYQLIVSPSGDAQGAGLNASGVYSERVAISRAPWMTGPPYLRADLVFSGNPGAINFQVMEATTDALSDYVAQANGSPITSATLAADGIHYIASVDLSPFQGNFALIYCNTQSANAVSLTSAKLSI